MHTASGNERKRMEEKLTRLSQSKDLIPFSILRFIAPQQGMSYPCLRSSESDLWSGDELQLFEIRRFRMLSSGSSASFCSYS